MRIAPLAFKENISRLTIKDICSITHKNDEAYAGALAIYYAIRFAIDGKWNESQELIPLVIEELINEIVENWVN